jgi:cytochrome c oxidase cbb3-type subunit 2
VARYRVITPLVLAKGADGRIRQCFFGSCLDDLPDPVQKAHFLRLGLVERIPEAQQSSIPADARQAVGIESDEDVPAAADDVNTDIVDECVKDLNHLGVQQDAGAPNARKALRESGRHYGNDVVHAAVRARKASLAAAL